MRSSSNFWLALHSLVDELNREGETSAQRADSLAGVYHSLSPVAQGVYLADLQIVLATLLILVRECDESTDS